MHAFAFFEEDQNRHHTLISGEVVRAVMAYKADEAVVNPVAVLAIYRPDGTCALQVTSNRDCIPLGTLQGSGEIHIRFAPFLLGPGDYVVSVALFEYLNIAANHEPSAYDLHDRCYILKVLPPPGIGVEIGIVNQTSEWQVSP